MNLNDEDCTRVEIIVDPLFQALEERLAGFPPKTLEKPSSTIHRVSSLMRDPELYQPRIISIGPYNRGSMRCNDMEEHKWYFFRDFLNRTSDSPLRCYISGLKEVEQKARHSYDSSIAVMSSNEFVQMLLMDGCFILEIIIKWYYGDISSLATDNVPWNISQIRSDLLLLGNQIPFFVIEKLFNLLVKKLGGDHSLYNILYGFFMDEYHEVPHRVSTEESGGENEIQHLLHLVYQWSIPYLGETKLLRNRSIPNLGETKFLRNQSKLSAPWISRTQVKERRPAIPSATWLVQAGVKFKNNQQSGRFLDVDFENGVLKAPTFRINPEQTSRLQNLMVFEQSKEPEDRIVASYILLMDSLIDTADDVELLKSCGVIQNSLESNHDAAAFFNRLGARCEVDRENHYYAPLFSRVSKFYKSSWNRNKASLKSKYFNSPWAAISIIGATVLMLLTGTQTYYTVAGYYPH